MKHPVGYPLMSNIISSAFQKDQTVFGATSPQMYFFGIRTSTQLNTLN